MPDYPDTMDDRFLKAYQSLLKRFLEQKADPQAAKEFLIDAEARVECYARAADSFRYEYAKYARLANDAASMRNMIQSNLTKYKEESFDESKPDRKTP